MRAQMLYAAARSAVYESVNRYWDELLREGHGSLQTRRDMGLARIHAHRTAREVAQLLFDTVGAPAVYESLPLGSLLRDCLDRFPDKRRGINTTYPMGDIAMAAFSVFFMQSPSFLAHQRQFEAGHGHSNCTSLFGIAKIPTDNHIRAMLDPASPDLLHPVFAAALDQIRQIDGGLDVFRRIVAAAPAHLGPGGWLLVEIGAGQDEAARRIAAGPGLVIEPTARDHDGHPAGGTHHASGNAPLPGVAVGEYDPAA